MSSISAVISTAIPVVGLSECRITRDVVKCERPVAELNRASSHCTASKYNARMHGLSSRNVCRASPGNRWSQRFFIVRAVDQSEALSEKDCSSKDVDDNSAAESATEIAEDMVLGVANDRGEQLEEVCSETPGSDRHEGQHPKSEGSVLGAVADSANRAADAMKRTFQKAGEFVIRTGEYDTQSSANVRDTDYSWVQGSHDILDKQLEQDGDAAKESHEAERDIIGDDNDAGESAADMGKETVSAIANAGHHESKDTTIQVEESSHDLRGQAKRVQEEVQEQALDIVDSIKSGASRASEQVQAAGRDVINIADHAFGFSHEEDEVLGETLKLRPEDFKEAYIEIDDGSSKESICL